MKKSLFLIACLMLAFGAFAQQEYKVESSTNVLVITKVGSGLNPLRVSKEQVIQQWHPTLSKVKLIDKRNASLVYVPFTNATDFVNSADENFASATALQTFLDANTGAFAFSQAGTSASPTDSSWVRVQVDTVYSDSDLWIKADNDINFTTDGAIHFQYDLSQSQWEFNTNLSFQDSYRIRNLLDPTNFQDAANKQYVDNKTWDASDIASGTFNDARIAESNVTQHEAALSILQSQITSNFVPSNITGITGATQVTNMVMISQVNYDAIVSPSATTLYIITD